jgi:hypothetical protein
MPSLFQSYAFLSLPAIVVFIWMPLLAIGIVVFRSFALLFQISDRIQWLLRDGKESSVASRSLRCLRYSLRGFHELGIGVVAITQFARLAALRTRCVVDYVRCDPLRRYGRCLS